MNKLFGLQVLILSTNLLATITILIIVNCCMYNKPVVDYKNVVNICYLSSVRPWKFVTFKQWYKYPSFCWMGQFFNVLSFAKHNNSFLTRIMRQILLRSLAAFLKHSECWRQVILNSLVFYKAIGSFAFPGDNRANNGVFVIKLTICIYSNEKVFLTNFTFT